MWQVGPLLWQKPWGLMDGHSLWFAIIRPVGSIWSLKLPECCSESPVGLCTACRAVARTGQLLLSRYSVLGVAPSKSLKWSTKGDKTCGAFSRQLARNLCSVSRSYEIILNRSEHNTVVTDDSPGLQKAELILALAWTLTSEQIPLSRLNFLTFTERIKNWCC